MRPTIYVPWLSPNIQLGRNTKNNFLDRRACQALVHPTIYPVHRPHIHHSGFFHFTYSNAIFWKLFLPIKRSKGWILMHVFNTYIYDIRLYVHCAYMWLCVHIWDHNPILVKFLDKESGKNSNGLVSARKKLPYGVPALIRGGLHQLGSLLTGVKAMQRVIKLTYIKRPKKSLKKLVRPSMISFRG